MSEYNPASKRSSPRSPIIIAIGNPGAGKSTLLNCLADQVLFEAGIAIGSGKTERLHRKENKNGIFYDTPGLADAELRIEAGKAISVALKEGGTFKLLFIVLQESGRILRQDVTTMKLVLDAAPEIGANYGVVINQVDKEVAEELQKPEALQKFVTSLFYGIDEARKCSHSNIMTILERSDLKCKKNMVVNVSELEDIEGKTFHDFVYNEVVPIDLTKDKADDVKAETFESAEKILEELQTQLNKDRELREQEYKRLKERFERAEEEKMRYKEKYEKTAREKQEKADALHKAEAEKAATRSALDESRMEVEKKSQAINALHGEVEFRRNQGRRSLELLIELQKGEQELKRKQMDYDHQETMKAMDVPKKKGIVSRIVSSIDKNKN